MRRVIAEGTHLGEHAGQVAGYAVADVNPETSRAERAERPMFGSALRGYSRPDHDQLALDPDPRWDLVELPDDDKIGSGTTAAGSGTTWSRRRARVAGEAASIGTGAKRAGRDSSTSRHRVTTIARPYRTDPLTRISATQSPSRTADVSERIADVLIYVDEHNVDRVRARRRSRRTRKLA